MSGGEFDYIQHRIMNTVDEIEDLIKEGLPYSDETKDKIFQTAVVLDKAAAMLNRVDWLISGDDGEESFHRRWEEDGL